MSTSLHGDALLTRSGQMYGEVRVHAFARGKVPQAEADRLVDNARFAKCKVGDSDCSVDNLER